MSTYRTQRWPIGYKIEYPHRIGDTLEEAKTHARENSTKNHDAVYHIIDEENRAVCGFYKGEALYGDDPQPKPTYHTFRLPELPLESMQVGDCIRVPVEDYSTEQIKTAIGSRVAEGVRFHLRYIEHDHHTLVRRIV